MYVAYKQLLTHRDNFIVNRLSLVANDTLPTENIYNEYIVEEA